VDAARLLAAALPQLRVETLQVLGRGWDSTAYLVNGELVFRLPDEPRDFTPEVRLLRELHGRLPVDVPDPVVVAPDGSFFGYRYLHGEPLRVAPAGFPELWARAVVAVDRALPPARATEIGVRPFAHLAQRLERVERARSTVPALADRVLAEYESRFENAARARPTTMHADLGVDHWLTDEAGGLTAIIDWSDACVAPIEHELANLWWLRDAQLVANATAAYAASTGYRPDVDLIALDHWANALSDIGALLERGEDAAPVIAHLHALT